MSGAETIIPTFSSSEGATAGADNDTDTQMDVEELDFEGRNPKRVLDYQGGASPKSPKPSAASLQMELVILNLAVVVVRSIYLEPRNTDGTPVRCTDIAGEINSLNSTEQSDSCSSFNVDGLYFAHASNIPQVRTYMKNNFGWVLPDVRSRLPSLSIRGIGFESEASFVATSQVQWILPSPPTDPLLISDTYAPLRTEGFRSSEDAKQIQLRFIKGVRDQIFESMKLSPSPFDSLQDVTTLALVQSYMAQWETVAEAEKQRSAHLQLELLDLRRKADTDIATAIRSRLTTALEGQEKKVTAYMLKHPDALVKQLQLEIDQVKKHIAEKYPQFDKLNCDEAMLSHMNEYFMEQFTEDFDTKKGAPTLLKILIPLVVSKHDFTRLSAGQQEIVASTASLPALNLKTHAVKGKEGEGKGMVIDTELCERLTAKMGIARIVSDLLLQILINAQEKGHKPLPWIFAITSILKNGGTSRSAMNQLSKLPLTYSNTIAAQSSKDKLVAFYKISTEELREKIDMTRLDTTSSTGRISVLSRRRAGGAAEHQKMEKLEGGPDTESGSGTISGSGSRSQTSAETATKSTEMETKTEIESATALQRSTVASSAAISPTPIEARLASSSLLSPRPLAMPQPPASSIHPSIPHPPAQPSRSVAGIAMPESPASSPNRLIPHSPTELPPRSLPTPEPPASSSNRPILHPSEGRPPPSLAMPRQEQSSEDLVNVGVIKVDNYAKNRYAYEQRQGKDFSSTTNTCSLLNTVHRKHPEFHRGKDRERACTPFNQSDIDEVWEILKAGTDLDLKGTLTDKDGSPIIDRNPTRLRHETSIASVPALSSAHSHQLQLHRMMSDYNHGQFNETFWPGDPEFTLQALIWAILLPEQMKWKIFTAPPFHIEMHLLACLEKQVIFNRLFRANFAEFLGFKPSVFVNLTMQTDRLHDTAGVKSNISAYSSHALKAFSDESEDKNDNDVDEGKEDEGVQVRDESDDEDEKEQGQQDDDTTTNIIEK
jgi:hypothetical protein